MKQLAWITLVLVCGNASAHAQLGLDDPWEIDPAHLARLSFHEMLWVHPQTRCLARNALGAREFRQLERIEERAGLVTRDVAWERWWDHTGWYVDTHHHHSYDMLEDALWDHVVVGVHQGGAMIVGTRFGKRLTWHSSVAEGQLPGWFHTWLDTNRRSLGTERRERGVYRVRPMAVACSAAQLSSELARYEGDSGAGSCAESGQEHMTYMEPFAVMSRQVPDGEACIDGVSPCLVPGDLVFARRIFRFPLGTEASVCVRHRDASGRESVGRISSVLLEPLEQAPSLMTSWPEAQPARGSWTPQDTFGGDPIHLSHVGPSLRVRGHVSDDYDTNLLMSSTEPRTWQDPEGMLTLTLFNNAVSFQSEFGGYIPVFEAPLRGPEHPEAAPTGAYWRPLRTTWIERGLLARAAHRPWEIPSVHCLLKLIVPPDKWEERITSMSGEETDTFSPWMSAFERDGSVQANWISWGALHSYMDQRRIAESTFVRLRDTPSSPDHAFVWVHPEGMAFVAFRVGVRLDIYASTDVLPESGRAAMDRWVRHQREDVLRRGVTPWERRQVRPVYPAQCSPSVLMSETWGYYSL